VDLLVVVSSLSSPSVRPGLIDRFLVAAERHEISSLLVINKMDLGEREEAQDLKKRYAGLGYDVVLSSVVTGEGIKDIRERLLGHTSLFVGHSGVGKSSILNLIDKRLGLKVADVSSKHGKGRHTTSSAVLRSIGADTYIVDSPGLREFTLSNMPAPAELGLYFPEIRDRLAGCRYPNCTHSHEPNCAIKKAVEAGEMVKERYESYLRILQGEERQPRSDSY
jgi:ribosome biogenesis GTPase